MNAITATVSLPASLRTASAPVCLLCGNAGARLHADVADYFFGMPGGWSMRRCGNAACRLVWQDPMVVPEDLGMAYAQYYTHAGDSDAGPGDSFVLSETFLRLDRWSNRLLRLEKDRYRYKLGYLDDAAPGRLLDVGCGSGSFAAEMQGRGWSVQGTDFDPQVASRLRAEHGFEVHIGELRALAFAASSFDAVTARHVIEHVPDPVEFVAECWRLLAPGGQMVLVTPNIDSLGHRHFGKFWRGLEQPRHLYLFGRPSMRRLFERAGLPEPSIFATWQGAAYILRSSAVAQELNTGQRWRHVAGAVAMWVIQVAEALAGGVLRRSVGEELIVVARKPPAGQ